MSLIGIITNEIARHCWGVNSCGHSLESISSWWIGHEITREDIDDIERELESAEKHIKECRKYVAKANAIMNSKGVDEMPLSEKEYSIDQLKKIGIWRR